MRFRNLALVLLMLALAVPAVAQEQRASIEGVIKDASGAVMPGVTIEAKNLEVGSVVSTVTDANGTYRFPALPAGTYDVTASLQGFNTIKSAAVPLALGQIKKVDLALSVAGLTESVQVTAESPLVDVKQSARATSIRGEQIDLLPKGRDFTTLVTQAPGANNESKLGGLSIDGASAGENRFIVDGIESTDIISGTQGKQLLTDFIDEVQVKSSGYTAEYGGATGGVISAVTKSGTNNFRGSIRAYFEGDVLTGSRNKSLRLKPTDSNAYEYWTYPEDSWTRYDPGFSLGGPIIRDKAWFFAAYQPRISKWTRDVSPTTAGTSTATTVSGVEEKYLGHNLSVNQTSQLGNNFRTRLAYNNSWLKDTGNLPSLTGSDPAGADYDINWTYPNWSASAQADWVATPNLFIGARGGYYFSDAFANGVPSDTRYIFSTGNNINLVGLDGTVVPSSFARPTGFSSVPTNSSTTRDQQTRLNAQVDATLYVNLLGQHTWKAGVQYDRLGNNVLDGEQANIVRIRWDSNLSGMRGNYGYYQVRSNGVYPRQGFITEGNVHLNNFGLFLQDAWTVNNKLTINLGIRTEQEKVPAYTKGEGIPDFGVEFGFGDKIAPRVGFAYDVLGDGKWKAYGSWGVFYDIFKLQLPRGSFGGDKWLEYYYSLDTYAWDTLATASGCPPACSGTLIRGPVDFRHPSFGSDAIEPDLKPMRSQEMSFGVEHQLSPTMAISARYVRKWLDRAIEDTGSMDAAGNEIYIIANPGEGLTKLAWTDPEVNQPKAKRDYDSVEVALTKNLSNNWYFRGSYMWSRLNGNYAGLSQSDEDGRTDPNVGRAFDYPIMSFDGNAKALFGPLATDRPHQVKGQFIYQAPWGSSIGVSQYVSSGLPVTREVATFPPNNFPLMYMGRKSDGRTPMYSRTDLSIQHALKFAGGRQLQFELNVDNLLDQRTAVSKFITLNRGGEGISFDESEFYRGQVNIPALVATLTPDARFLKDSGFQGGRAARVGVRFLF